MKRRQKKAEVIFQITNIDVVLISAKEISTHL